MNRIFELLDRSKDNREQESSECLQSVLNIEPIRPEDILPDLDSCQQLNLDFSDIELQSLE